MLYKKIQNDCVPENNCVMYIEYSPELSLVWGYHMLQQPQELHLLTWINFNPSMDK